MTGEQPHGREGARSRTERQTFVARPLGALIERLEARGVLRGVVGVLDADRRTVESVDPGSSSDLGSSRDRATLAGIEITNVTSDSRDVQPGCLYVALRGARLDGHAFIRDAVRQGAVAVIVEQPEDDLEVPQLIVDHARPALAMAAAWCFGDPGRQLGVVGITGTDGKTTTGYLVRAVLEAAGLRAGSIGTVEVVVGGHSLGNPSRATTPEAPAIQAHLAAMVAAGDRWAIVESTSHGLAQDRVREVPYDVAVLTNVSHEHLEFHGTLEAYRAAKRRLFEWLAVGPANPEKSGLLKTDLRKTGIVNADDPHAALFLEATREAGGRCMTYGVDEPADVRAVEIHEDADGLRLRALTPRGELRLRLRIAGRFNADNALAALAVGEALELDPSAIVRGLEGVAGVPGRMERIDLGQPFPVIVDYAHTPDALAKVLDNLAPLTTPGSGGLIAVFGSAGERDATKRVLMGQVAGERCRLVVLTDEDPRGEDRGQILAEIAAGAEERGRRRDRELMVIPDRRAAIAWAIGQARAGDVVLLAGKGHEQTIEGPTGSAPWNEHEAARAALIELGYRATA